MSFTETEGRKESTMIRLGDIITTKMGNTTRFWLTKDNKTYLVMGFIPGKGWYRAFDGSLKQARNYIKEAI